MVEMYCSAAVPAAVGSTRTDRRAGSAGSVIGVDVVGVEVREVEVEDVVEEDRDVDVGSSEREMRM